MVPRLRKCFELSVLWLRNLLDDANVATIANKSRAANFDIRKQVGLATLGDFQSLFQATGFQPVVVDFCLYFFSEISTMGFLKKFGSKWDLIFLFGVLFFPRLLNPGLFLTPDEIHFLNHARDFAVGLSQGDFSKTLGIGYPGVTVALWAAPVVGLAQTELGAYVAGRIVTILVNGLLLGLVYLLARLLMGRWPAFWSVSLLALDPYVLGYSRVLHNGVPLSLFMTLAGLSFLLWLNKPRWRWIILSGICTGLALLTKSTALLLAPMLTVLLISWFLSGRIDAEKTDHTLSSLKATFYSILPKLGGLFIIIFIAIIVFWVFWPAMWSIPVQAIDLTFGKLLNDQEAGTGNFGFFWMGQFIQNPGPFFYPVAFLLKATPWLIVGLCLSVWQSWVYFTRFEKERLYNPTLNLPLWGYVLIYLTLMTIASKKSVRYLLPAFPVFYLLIGLAFYQYWQSVKQHFGFWRSRAFSQFFHPATLLFFCVAFALIYHPYYFTYYNPLVIGWLWAPQTLMVGWGEGLDQAAHYLNQKPTGMTVSAWYTSLFDKFYHNGQLRDVGVENVVTADKVVFYINQVQRGLPNPHVVHYFRTRLTPEYTVRLNGIEYAWIYPGPIVGPQPDLIPTYPLGGEFDQEVKLLGYDLSQPVLSGRPLIVTLHWQVLNAISADRFVFVRLVDAEGQVWAKTDSPPLLGIWPLSLWHINDVVNDAQELSIPAGTPPGNYRLEVGWYDPVTGQPLPASGQPLGEGGGLLLGEIQLGWQSLSAQPELLSHADIRLAPNARLVGYTAPLTVATAGDILPIHLAWREADSMFDFYAATNDKVMFEWRQNDRPIAEQLTSLPWPIAQWGSDALLLSQHQVIVPPTLSNGHYDLVVMLHNGSKPAGDSFLLGQVEVTSPPHYFELPTGVTQLAGQTQLERGISLVGYKLDHTKNGFKLNLYWQTNEILTRQYKIFAQLLTADDKVVAQSDGFPAEGQRPTTGWLPNEIITDPHYLSFTDIPHPGTYRLIIGLYDPLTGQRLPLINDQSDAIFVTEVTFP